MPEQEKLAQMFDSLVSHGCSFLERSNTELQDEPHFSIVHFAAGLELLLKPRLFYEHWSLVSAQPHNTPWESVENGSMTSISAKDLVNAISRVTNAQLRKEEKIFKEVFDHRNRSLHFLPGDDTQTVAAEQFRSWYYLHPLLAERWKDIFTSHRERIANIDRSFRTHTACLAVRYEELRNSNRFSAASNEDSLTLCLVCNFESGIVADATSPITLMECPVCLSELTVANFNCGQWHDISEGIFDSISCENSGKHTAQELAELIDETPPT